VEVWKRSKREDSCPDRGGVEVERIPRENSDALFGAVDFVCWKISEGKSFTLDVPVRIDLHTSDGTVAQL
jgi:hypothetical protein